MVYRNTCTLITQINLLPYNHNVSSCVIIFTLILGLKSAATGAPITVMSQVTRDYLHPSEIDKLLSAAKLSPRHGLRNHLMILLAYRHALRISEVTDLRVSDVNLDEGRIYCRRLKGSVSNTHPMDGDEIRLCRRWFKVRPKTAIDFVFVSERGSPLTRQSAWRIVAEAGERAKLDLDIHPHMLKHSCGYYLANKGLDTRLIQDYMGHKQIQNTVRYTATNAKRFEGLWG